MFDLERLKLELADEGFKVPDAFRIMITPRMVEAWSYVTDSQGRRQSDTNGAPRVIIDRYEFRTQDMDREIVP